MMGERDACSGLTLTLGKVANNGIAVSSMAPEVAFVTTARIALSTIADIAIEIASVAVGVAIYADLKGINSQLLLILLHLPFFCALLEEQAKKFYRLNGQIKKILF